MAGHQTIFPPIAHYKNEHYRKTVLGDFSEMGM
jgi:hypothetical protein